MKFSVCYAIITDESAEYGEAEESGFIDQGLSLRDAIGETFRTRSNTVDGIVAIEASCYPLPAHGILEFTPSCTIYNGMNWENGEYENRSLHPEQPITASSWRRICRLIGARD